MNRILLIHSYHPNGVSDSEFRERLINRNPNLSKFDFANLGIFKIEKDGDFDYKYLDWDFGKQLELLSTQFKPDYIMVHTGLAFERHPSFVIETLINVLKILPDVKVGFQDGKESATRIGILGGDGHPGHRRYGEALNNNALSFLENHAAFQETAELKELIKEIYFSRQS